MVTLHFHAELNDFLPENQRNSDITHKLEQVRSIKDLFESFGVPHPEVNTIIVNQQSVNFSYLVQLLDNVDLYPVSLIPAISPLIPLIPVLETPRFILDVHLGKLASYLRMLGFDTLYRNDYDDPELASISSVEDRILLTCDRKLLMRKEINYGYFVRSRIPSLQVREIFHRFELAGKQKPFTRCMSCNGAIAHVDKLKIEARLLPNTRKYYHDFYQCNNYEKIYWEGSHLSGIQQTINQFIS